jgi:uncharacterized protein
MIERAKLSKSGLLMIVLTFCLIKVYGQGPALAIKEIEDHRKKQEGEMRDKEKSPLQPKDRKKFKHLNYFPIDLKYRVNAKFLRTENQPLFKMKTTTTRLPEYTKYGEVHFTIDAVDYVLNVYQSPEISQRPGFEDYLFIPFTDTTNGNETYDVGRYIEFKIPKSEEVIVDFNQSYNPYCSYSPTFSCPIPPAENDLPIAIPAGEKKFH